MNIAISIALLIALVLLIVVQARAGHQWKMEHPKAPTLKENDHFKAGLFYSNKEDPRIFVPKRSGGGFTLNLGNPITYALLFTFSFLLILLIFFPPSG